MRPRVVCDASAVVAVLLDSGPDGQWATDALTGVDLAAPSLLLFEAANIVRRHELAALISADQAAQAHSDILDLAIEQWPYELVAARAWQVRQNLTTTPLATSPSPNFWAPRSSPLTVASAALPGCNARSLHRKAIRVRSLDAASTSRVSFRRCAAERGKRGARSPGERHVPRAGGVLHEA